MDFLPAVALFQRRSFGPGVEGRWWSSSRVQRSDQDRLTTPGTDHHVQTARPGSRETTQAFLLTMAVAALDHTKCAPTCLALRLSASFFTDMSPGDVLRRKRLRRAVSEAAFPGVVSLEVCLRSFTSRKTVHASAWKSRARAGPRRDRLRNRIAGQFTSPSR